MHNLQLLFVDDEQSILQMLKTIFQKEGFQQIHTATSGEEALKLCKQHSYKLILLDVTLPGQSGLEICPQLRLLTDAPIFFLTARSSDLDKLSGFALGADDYITKPFNPLEVVARVKAHFRRYSMPKEQIPTLIFDDLRIDTTSGDVYVRGEKVKLPAQLYQLLIFFCKHPNQLFSKRQLYEQVWGESFFGEDNTVMVHIRKLREKIELNPSQPNWIVTVRGLGYKFVANGNKS